MAPSSAHSGNTTSNKLKPKQSYWGSNAPPLPRPLRQKQAGAPGDATGGNEHEMPFISKVQADLLFKKHTYDLSKSNLSAEAKKQAAGLHRMDFKTFNMALADIAKQLYSSYFNAQTGQLAPRTEA